MKLARLRSVTIGLAAFASVLYGLQWVQQFVAQDPLLKYREQMFGGNSRIAILLEDVSFRQYRGAKLVSRANIAKIEVTKDRQILYLTGVSQARYFADNGRSFDFDSPTGTWSNANHIFVAKGGVRLQNTDLKLTTPEITYIQADGELRIPGQIKGKLFQGTVEAVDFRYRLANGAFSVGPIAWTGRLQTGDPIPAKSKWTIKAMGATRPPGDIEVWRTGEATDGDVIVKADRIERNVKTDVIVATGKVQYFSSDANLLCTKATVYRKEKRAVLEGDVSMLIKPEDQKKLEVVEVQPVRPIVPDSIAAGRPQAPQNADDQKKLDDEVRSSENRRKYPVSVYSARVEYWYQKGKRHATISGAPQARQEMPGNRWRQVWALIAYYDGEKETLKLDSSKGGKETRIKTSIGDDLTATWFTISTKEKDDSWEAEGLSGDVVAEDEDLNNRKPGSGTTVEAPPTKKPNTEPLRGPIRRDR